jgi:hypothetical protein
MSKKAVLQIQPFAGEIGWSVFASMALTKLEGVPTRHFYKPRRRR